MTVIGTASSGDGSGDDDDDDDDDGGDDDEGKEEGWRSPAISTSKSNSHGCGDDNEQDVK